MATVLLDLLQERRHHEDDVQQSIELHRREIAQRARHHEESLTTQKRLHHHELHLEKELHEAEMRLGEELASRDSTRDMMEQRKRVLEMLTIVDTLFLGCTYGIVYTFVPPQGSANWHLTIYGLTLSCAICFLVFSIFLSMTLQSRIINFHLNAPLLRYSCGKRHKNFNSYYDHDCRSIETLAFRMLYCGASFAIACSSVLFTITQFHIFQNLGPGFAFSLLSAVGILVLWIGDFYFVSDVVQGTVDEDAEMF